MRSFRTAAFLAIVIASGACDKVRQSPGPTEPSVEVAAGDPAGGPGGGTVVVGVSGCTRCHGTPGLDATASDPLVAAAPPRTATGATVGPVVGAHRAHLVNGALSNAMECASCHLVPTRFPHPAQAQGKVTFSRLATKVPTGAPLTPTWNGTTCASTYCHGTFTNGNAANAPAWSSGAAGAQCGSCHGLPPGGSHPQDPVGGPPLDCGGCHTGYTRTSVDVALHVNGRVDGGGHPPGWKEPDQHGLAALQEHLSPCAACHVGFGPATGGASSSCDGCHADPALYGPYATGTYPAHPSWQTECTFCHGGRDGSSGAPPRNTHVVSSDLATPQATTDPTIGAHTSHVGTAASAPATRHAIATALDCTDCHATRWASALDPGHVDAATADVLLAGGSYGRPSCSATYCHGDFRGGAGTGAISWTGAFGASFTLSCASCHAIPPAASATVPHPPNVACGTCHPGYGAGSVTVATHVDGTVQHQPATGCTQCHGDLAVAGVANTDVRAAPGGDANAVDAHGNPATANGSRGVGTHAKHLTSQTWRSGPIACGECHAVPATGDTSHANGNPALAFGTLARTAWAGQPAITPAWNGAGGAATLTCSSTYCHGAFKNGANAAPTWTAVGSVTCGSCHGVSATFGPGGTHPTFGAGQNCGSCHGGSYTNTAVDPALHLNGALEVANLTCSSCHGDPGRTPVASATGLDPLNAPLVLASPPVDAGHGTAATGAHLAHVNQGDPAAPGPLSNALSCATCHPVPASTAHSDGTVQVTFSGLARAAGATPPAYDFASHGCSSTYCHGRFTGGAGANPVAWTAAGKLGCTGCHGAPPGPTSATLHHPPNPGCGSCHASYTISTVSVATHVDGTVQHAPATGCTQCHGDLAVAAVPNTDVRSAPAGDANAVDAHGNAATAATARGVGAHGKHLTSTTWRQAPIACAECHAVPAAGDVSHANGNPVLAFGALARTAWAGQPAITPVWNGAGGGATVTCSSTYCHGAFPNGALDQPSWTSPGSVACGSCHGVSATNGPGGSHPTLSAGQNCGTCHGGAYTNTAVDKALHLNGQLDGGGESGGGSACGGCHGAIFNAMNGTVAKASRHALGATAGTNDSPTDSGITWANPLSGNAAAARSCVNMCHGDHPHDLVSPATATHENNAYLDATSGATRANGSANRVGVGGTGGTPNRSKSDYDGTQANGGMCVSCHRNPVNATHPAVDRAAFDASAHDFAVNTAASVTYGWSYQLHDGGLFARNCTKCHASNAEGNTPQAGGTGVTAVHYGDNASLLAGTSRPAGTAAGFVCYNCHGSGAAPAAGAQGNRSGKDIQSQIAHATAAGQSGHPANSDAVHDSVAELANATFGSQLGLTAGSVARHASCMDCHDPHEARAGAHAAGTNVAGPPLQGAWGAQLSTNPAFWSNPTSASFTKKTIVAGTDLEATLCFKCHSSFYGTLPTSPSGGFTETDTAKEFNPGNTGNYATAGTANQWSSGETAGGYHPVLASAGSNLGVTSNLKAPWTTASLMTCSDCHESDQTTDPNGPHGSAAPFILKGPQTTWNGALVNGAAMPANAFCSNCHNTSWSTSRFTGHGNGRHNVACFNCHAAIPHGGPRPGVLVAPAGAAAGVGGSIAGWDATAPYYGLGTSSSKLYILSYPTSRTAGWGQSNCGCNGATH